MQAELLQRQCACGQHTVAGGECADCRKKRLNLQHRATNQAEPISVLPIVHDVLRPPGQPLDAPTRAFMEARFGRDFSLVRVHTDAKPVNALASTVPRDVNFHPGPYAPPSQASGRPLPAGVRIDAERRLRHPVGHVRLHDDVQGGWTALSFGARAVTVGHHIYVAPGQLGGEGCSLLMHELAHVAAQDAALGVQPGVAPPTHPIEQVARSIAAGYTPALPRVPVGIYRAPMRRADFEQQMRRFGVRRIFTATLEQQRDRLNYFGAGRRPGDQLSPSSWTSWDPGGDSPVYDWIVAAFAAFARRLGGVPAVQELGFYAMAYELNSAGTLVRRPNVAAEYGGGRMAVYRSAVTRATGFTLPTGRSTAGAPAPLRHLAREQGVIQAVTHELGHGLVETALTPRAGARAPDPAFMNDYRRAAGWTAGSRPALYDAGVPEVQTALATGRTPPAAYRITQTNWNDLRWIEQPLTQYMTTHPSEDLPEATAAYVNTPDLLRQRSPRRFAFLELRKAALGPYLRSDLATVRLRPTEAELRALLDELTVPPWLRPVPRPQPTPPPGSRIRLRPGPVLEIRF